MLPGRTRWPRAAASPPAEGCLYHLKSNWKSPTGFDTIRFTNLLRLDHADGTRTELRGGVTNSILQARRRRWTEPGQHEEDSVAERRGGDQRAGAQKADLALFASTERRPAAGRCVRLPTPHPDGGAATQSVLLKRSELSRPGTRCGGRDLERRLDGSSRAGHGCLPQPVFLRPRSGGH